MYEYSLLYVEDDKDTVEDVKFFLKRYFNEINIAYDGKEALEVFKKTKPNIIILDVELPSLNGLDLAEKIRQIDDSVPIIFLTAYSDEEKLLKAINIQAFSYLIKPFDLDELVNAIKKSIKFLEKDSTPQTIKKKIAEDFIWDYTRKRLSYKNIKISLTKNEIEIVEFFLKNPNRFFTVDEINESLFCNSDVKNNSIVQLLSRFRKKVVEQTGGYFIIDNVYNKGYILK